MSSSHNSMSIIGHLGRDPELEETKTGVPKVRIGIATNYRKPGGEDETVWHTVLIFGDSAVNFAKICTKGSLVFIEGRVFYAEFEGRDGTKKREARISGRTWQHFGHREARERHEPDRGAGIESGEETPGPNYGPDPDMDDLPF